MQPPVTTMRPPSAAGFRLVIGLGGPAVIWSRISLVHRAPGKADGRSTFRKATLRTNKCRTSCPRRRPLQWPVRSYGAVPSSWRLSTSTIVSLNMVRRQAEIRQANAAHPPPISILAGFQIAVNDAAAMGEAQAFGNLNGDVQNGFGIERLSGVLCGWRGCLAQSKA